MSNSEISILADIAEAQAGLDRHVREMVAWHFDPETGCPFWLEFAEGLDFDPVKEIGGYEDLKLLGHFQDEWLRGGPVTNPPSAQISFPGCSLNCSGSFGSTSK